MRILPGDLDRSVAPLGSALGCSNHRELTSPNKSQIKSDIKFYIKLVLKICLTWSCASAF